MGRVVATFGPVRMHDTLIYFYNNNDHHAAAVVVDHHHQHLMISLLFLSNVKHLFGTYDVMSCIDTTAACRMKPKSLFCWRVCVCVCVCVCASCWSFLLYGFLWLSISISRNTQHVVNLTLPPLIMSSQQTLFSGTWNLCSQAW